MDNTYLFLTIVIISAVTAVLRFLPFIVFSGGKKTPHTVLYLGKVLPFAIMSMLVVYCLKDVNFLNYTSFLPAVIAGTLVAVSYVWKRNTLISIALGTVSYMLLVQLIF